MLLLKLEEEFGSILTAPETEADLSILELYDMREKQVSNETGHVLLQAFHSFNYVIATHLDESLSQ